MMVEDQVGVEREESERSWGGNHNITLVYAVHLGAWYLLASYFRVIYVFPLRPLFPTLPEHMFP
jgi:hypothetical protein